jgi:hypothetical protein
VGRALRLGCVHGHSVAAVPRCRVRGAVGRRRHPHGGTPAPAHVDRHVMRLPILYGFSSRKGSSARVSVGRSRGGEPCHAYRVGLALAYLVRRMDSFCATQAGDVLMYKPRDRSRIPDRIPAMDVLNGQARSYDRHRELYPEDHREILDGMAGLLADPEDFAMAREGFLSALSTPVKRGAACWT